MTPKAQRHAVCLKAGAHHLILEEIPALEKALANDTALKLTTTDDAMITYKILAREAAADNTHYYNDQKDDYYSRDSGAAVWQGEGAYRLGAAGEVDLQRFHAMLRGNFGHGITVGKSVRKDSRARAGIDLTFSAPKSITLQALVAGDERLIKAHDQAVAFTLAYIERHAARGRQKENGKTRTEETGNLIIAKFRHETARPTPDAPPDPALHTHAVIMNATQRADGTWASLSNEEIVKRRMLYDAVYNAQLDYRVQRLGYETRYEKHHIELAHISRQAIEAFSKRQAQIAASMAAHGIDIEGASRQQREPALLATRQDKAKEYSRAELHAAWVQQAQDIGIDFNAKMAPEASRQDLQAQLDKPPERMIADRALTWAIAHLAERESVMPRAELLAAAVRQSGGMVAPEIISDAIRRRVDAGQLLRNPALYRIAADMKAEPLTRQAWAQQIAVQRDQPMDAALATVDRAINQGRLVVDEPLFATPAAYAAEKRITNMERTGRDTMEPVMSAQALQEAMEDSTLTDGQRDALGLILTDQNQIVGIQGLAGTGKSFALQSTQRLLQDHDFNMIALAPYGSQVSNLRRDGIEANTVASFLTAADKRRFTDNMGPQTIVVIDEAGVVPVRQMDKLLAKITATGARVVALGDTAQTKAVEAGRAFALLQEHGMKTVTMGDIQRQKSSRLRRAVELAASGMASQSLPLIDRVACVKDTFDEDEHGNSTRNSSARYEAIAGEYTALSNDDQAKTLIVTGTNTSRKAINNLVHAKRGLAGRGRQYKLLTRHDTTRAERACAKYYTVGDIVQPERDYQCGLKRGTLYRVVERERRFDRISVLPLGPDNQTGKPIEIIPKTMGKLSVYHVHEAELSVGDWVRITRNNAAADLVSGQRAEVVAINTGTITLNAGGKHVELPTDRPLHLDHAYATTAHSAQGLTCDRVFYNAESFSKTTAQDTYYVSISRERHEVVVFTDDVTALPKAVDRVPYKGLAHDLAGSDHELAKHVLQAPELGAIDDMELD